VTLSAAFGCAPLPSFRTCTAKTGLPSSLRLPCFCSSAEISRPQPFSFWRHPLFLLHIFFEGHHCFSDFLFAQERFPARDPVLQPSNECVLVQLNILALEIKTNIEPKL